MSDVSLGQQLRGEMDQSISRVTRLLSNNGLITVLCLEFRMQCNAPTLDIRYKRCGVVDAEGRGYNVISTPETGQEAAGVEN